CLLDPATPVAPSPPPPTTLGFILTTTIHTPPAESTPEALGFSKIFVAHSEEPSTERTTTTTPAPRPNPGGRDQDEKAKRQNGVSARPVCLQTKT
ncbi:hypothetical protein BDZ91DRAFT_750748, partial [Kalaharituber pfeilii]